MTVGATSSSGQNTKSAGFRNRLLPRRTRLQSFQLCVTLTASGETITSEHHFTHKLFNKRKKSSHTRLKTTTKKKITSWHLEFPLTLSTNLSAAWRTGLSPSGAPWRRSVGSQRKSNSVFKKAKLRKTWETVAGLCRCSLSSHPAKRAHWRCANASNTCLLYASSHPQHPPPLPYRHHPRLLSWRPEVGEVLRWTRPPPVLLRADLLKLREITTDGKLQMDRRQIWFALQLSSCWKLHLSKQKKKPTAVDPVLS